MRVLATKKTELYHEKICPEWTKVSHQENDCPSRKYIRITPTLGFGNKLNGVLQGALGAYWLNRCLIIEWSYRGQLSNSSSWTAATAMHERIRSLTFPKSYKDFQKLLRSSKNSALTLDMKVGYRDNFCRFVNSFASPIGLSERVREKMRQRKSLCIFLEGCILRGHLKPNRILQNKLNKIKNSWLKPDSVSVAIQVRMGDYISINKQYKKLGSDLMKSKDERIPPHVLNLFWVTAQAHASKDMIETSKKSVSYFLATDSRLALEDAKKVFPDQGIFYTFGNLRHSDLEVQDDSSEMKMLLDWFLLAEADIVIQGPWSSFVEKALVYSLREQQIVRCHSSEDDKIFNKNLIRRKDGWACFINNLQDTEKGPRAVDT